MVRVLTVNEPRCIDEAVAVLKAGGLVCYPTDTVYGIGALVTDDRAVRRLFVVKGRAREKAMPLLLADAQDVARVVVEVSPLARGLMERFWPGGLTIVLKKARGFRSLALAKADTVAVRVPDQPLVREFIRRAGEPLTGTSANRSGQRSPLTAVEVADQMGQAVDLIIDGGRCPGGVESTVVDITEGRIQIVREGAIRRQELEGVVGQHVMR